MARGRYALLLCFGAGAPDGRWNVWRCPTCGFVAVVRPWGMFSSDGFCDTEDTADTSLGYEEAGRVTTEEGTNGCPLRRAPVPSVWNVAPVPDGQTGTAAATILPEV